MKYVCGFAFTHEGAFTPRVLLLEKHGSLEWMDGMFNGLGGKIEQAEGIRSAMAREFEEEAGIKTDPIEWLTFHHERWRSGNEVYFLCTRINEVVLDDAVLRQRNAREPLALARLSDNGVTRGVFPMLPNLHYLIPMAWHYVRSSVQERPL